MGIKVQSYLVSWLWEASGKNPYCWIRLGLFAGAIPDFPFTISSVVLGFRATP